MGRDGRHRSFEDNARNRYKPGLLVMYALKRAKGQVIK